MRGPGLGLTGAWPAVDVSGRGVGRARGAHAGGRVGGLGPRGRARSVRLYGAGAIEAAHDAKALAAAVLCAHGSNVWS
jgi:hypothetical protein